METNIRNSLGRDLLTLNSKKSHLLCPVISSDSIKQHWMILDPPVVQHGCFWDVSTWPELQMGPVGGAGAILVVLGAPPAGSHGNLGEQGAWEGRGAMGNVGEWEEKRSGIPKSSGTPPKQSSGGGSWGFRARWERWWREGKREGFGPSNRVGKG